MKIDQLTFTRFVAALAIVAYHFGKHLFPFNDPSVSFIFKQANTGVSYFFVLSGFVMIVAYQYAQKIDAAKYWQNRFARIYPVYACALLILLAFEIFVSQSVEYTGLFLNIFMLQAWTPGWSLSFNFAGWSLSAELFFYAIFPFLYNHFYTKKDYKKLILPVFLIWLTTQCIFVYFSSSAVYTLKIHDLIYYLPLLHVNEFLIGNLAGLIFIKKLKNKNGNYDWLVCILSALIILAFKFPILNLHDGMLAILFAALLLALSVNTGFITRILKSKMCVFLGEISYGVYILQYPVYAWTRSFLVHFKLDTEQRIFFGAVFMLVCTSALSYIFIEAPLREKIKKLQIFRAKKQKESSVENSF